MACTSEKVWEIAKAISVEFVQWEAGSSIPSGLTFIPAAENEMKTHNGGNGMTLKSGKLSDAYFAMTHEVCLEKKDLMWFRISTLNGHEQINGDFLVARPCPPFCEGGGVLKII